MYEVYNEDTGKADEPGGIEFKSVACELKTIDDDRNRLSGRAAVFFNIDSGRDIIAAGAFKAGLGDLSRIFVGGLNHNWDQPIARVLQAKEIGGALEFESGPIVDTTHGSDVKKLIQAGIIDRASIGYKALEFKHLNGPSEVKSYWKSVGYQPTEDDIERSGGKVRLLTRIKLFEVSPVTIPMNERASIAAVKCGGCGGSCSKAEEAPEPGTDFAAHSRLVVSAGEGFVSRAESRCETRFKVGRMLSQANIDEIEAVAASMSASASRLVAILERASSNGKVAAPVNPRIDPAEVGRFHAWFMNTIERPYLLGQ
jgi:hypothetical protein